LVFDDSKGERKGDDVDVFVADVDSGVAGQVAEKVVWGIEVGDSVGLVADEVVETVCAVGVDEAVANPYTGTDAIPILAH
jgi:hypothetical protein